MADIVCQVPPLSGYAASPKKSGVGECDALTQIPIILASLNKASGEKSPKSFFSLFLGSVLPSQFSGMIGNTNVTPDQIAFGVVSAFGAANIMDSGVSGNLLGLWQGASQSSNGDVNSQANGLKDAFNIFAKSLASIPAVNSDTQAIFEAKAALNAFISEGGTDASSIEGELNRVCTSLGIGSELIFDLQRSGDLLKSSSLDLSSSLDIPSGILGAAGNAILGATQLSGKNLNTNFSSCGAENILQIASVLNGINSVNLNSPDSIGQISVLSQACQMIDDFYGGVGNGSVNWNGLTSYFASNVSSQDMLNVSAEAKNFSPFIGSDITNPLFDLIDESLFAAFRNGGSDNLAQQTIRSSHTQLDRAIAAASAVATIYSTGKSISPGFANGMNVMRQVGAGGAYQSMLTGFVDKFMNMNPIDILGIASQIAGMRACGRDSGSSIAPALLDGIISKFIAKSNVSGHMLVGSGDAAGYFIDANNKLKIATEKARKIAASK